MFVSPTLLPTNQGRPMQITKAAVVASCALLLPPVLMRAQRSDDSERNSPKWPTHGWARGTPASVGLDEKVLSALDTDLGNGKYSMVDSLTVIRCGTDVFEKTYSH